MNGRLTIDSGHDKPNLGRVGGTCEVCVDLLLLGLVQGHESVQNVIAGRSVVSAAFVVGEVILHGADGELLLEAVNLVEEENDRGLDEPAGVANRVEQSQRFLHTVDGLIFKQQLVILGDGDQEQDGGDVLEAVDPLFTLGALTADIEHAVSQIPDDERGFRDTSRLDTGAEDILVARQVVGLGDSLNGVEVATNVSSREQIIAGTDSTHYLAESLSWYSRDRRKHSWTPASRHRAWMAPPTS